MGEQLQSFDIIDLHPSYISIPSYTIKISYNCIGGYDHILEKHLLTGREPVIILCLAVGIVPRISKRSLLYVPTRLEDIEGLDEGLTSNGKSDRDAKRQFSGDISTGQLQAGQQYGSKLIIN